jgi:hypothetical protein
MCLAHWASSPTHLRHWVTALDAAARHGILLPRRRRPRPCRCWLPRCCPRCRAAAACRCRCCRGWHWRRLVHDLISRLLRQGGLICPHHWLSAVVHPCPGRWQIGSRYTSAPQAAAGPCGKCRGAFGRTAHLHVRRNACTTQQAAERASACPSPRSTHPSSGHSTIGAPHCSSNLTPHSTPSPPAEPCEPPPLPPCLHRTASGPAAGQQPHGGAHRAMV